MTLWMVVVCGADKTLATKYACHSCSIILSVPQGDKDNSTIATSQVLQA